MLCKSSEGFRDKATKGEAVLLYCEPLATQDLESSDDLHDCEPPATRHLGPLGFFNR